MNPPETGLTPIPTDWNGEDYEMWLVCAPASPGWRIAMRNMARTISRYRFWDTSTGNPADVLPAAEEVFESMNMCQALLDQIAECCASLTTAINASVPVSDMPGSPPDTDPVTDPPPGDWPTWNDYHCAAGHAMVDEIAGRLRAFQEAQDSGWLAVASILFLLASAAVIGLSGGGAVVVIGATVLEALAIFGAIQALGSVGLGAIADDLEANADLKNDIGCALRSASAAAAAASARAAVGDNVAEPAATLVAYLVTDGLVEVFWRGGTADGELDLSMYDSVACNCAGNLVLYGEFTDGEQDFDTFRTTWYADYNGIVRLTPNGIYEAHLAIDDDTLTGNGVTPGVIENARVEMELWRGGDDNSQTGEACSLWARRESDGQYISIWESDVVDLPGPNDIPGDSLVVSVNVPWPLQLSGSNTEYVSLRYGPTGSTRHLRCGYMALYGDYQ